MFVWSKVKEKHETFLVFGGSLVYEKKYILPDPGSDLKESKLVSQITIPIQG